MKLSHIVHTLRHFSPSFAGRVGGAAAFSAIKDTALLKLPAAYVVPLDDRAQDNKPQTDYWQNVTESFGVIVVLKPLDEQGQHEAYDIVENIKTELWRALLGLEPSPSHNPIQYDGGGLLDLDQGRLFYQFNFSAVREVGFDNTRQHFDLNAIDNPIPDPDWQFDPNDPDAIKPPQYNPLNIGNFDTLSGTINELDSGVTVNFQNNNIYEGNNDN
ncbi:phage tail terminator protein [Gilliamella sp. Fer4-1]|uniref:phage tail terminator protein n=1 Tax=Gilliamella sp. Fer4-1 TaxID=3120242 RepID=UPI00080E5CDE|nr:hypothetical protein [Gilliamella apicola]OCG64017.1 hypothetical protein A9G30_07750 [Gilliamella apicola]